MILNNHFHAKIFVHKNFCVKTINHCYNHKYNKTEVYDKSTDKIISLYHPRQQNWHEHFRWNEDFTLVIRLTATGRVTVEALQLNRQGLA